MKSRFLFALVLFLQGCSYWSSPSISVRTLYDSAEKLPSVREDTPDPRKPLLGKSYTFLVHWSSPSSPSPHLQCFYRFEDRAIIEQSIPLEGTRGHILLEVERSLIREHGSLCSYKIVLKHEDKELISSQHKLWVSPIVVK